MGQVIKGWDQGLLKFVYDISFIRDVFIACAKVNNANWLFRPISDTVNAVRHRKFLVRLIYNQ